MKSKQSIENYLETIFNLQKTQAEVHSVDIANALNFTKASVSIAMKRLKEEGRIEVNSHGVIHLTESGFNLARSVHEKHEILSNFFIHMGIDTDVAKEEACLIEHIISNESFEKIKKFYKDLKGNEN